MNYLPFAVAPTIVRANQKDTYFETLLNKKLTNLLSECSSSMAQQRPLQTYKEEIKSISTFLYLALTTLAGSKTLGEEYVDLVYVNKTGRRIAKWKSKVGFVLSFTIVPYLIKKLIKILKKNMGNDNCTITRTDHWSTKLKKIILNVSSFNLLDLANLHLALFYFFGEYYQFGKRLFGLRYALGHDSSREPNGQLQQQQKKRGYEFLGLLIIFQIFFKNAHNLKQLWITLRANTSIETPTDTNRENKQNKNNNLVYGLADNRKSNSAIESDHSNAIELSDPNVLPYIPEHSRNCMLCLCEMTDPTCASCGHVFCWGCILDWCKERQECPLCRASVKQASLLPLR
ncbi:unnamed protein product [Ambrosiozyma monospora]|uniref:RING-type E3 ubiquitin transferase n=1 Tax=Ambrosiozyma monospora TaxID=43982 RepID=A0A9W7DJM2_AMBMO|nr:unnamed protein product [Ambrosiozyma monospora]